MPRRNYCLAQSATVANAAGTFHGHRDVAGTRASAAGTSNKSLDHKCTAMTHHSAPSRITPPCGQRRLTLIEIMVAITLSIVLLGSVLQIYLVVEQTYRVTMRWPACRKVAALPVMFCPMTFA